MSCKPEAHVIQVLPGHRIEAFVYPDRDGHRGLRYRPQYLVGESHWQDYLPDRFGLESLKDARNVIARAVGLEEV